MQITYWLTVALVFGTTFMAGWSLFAAVGGGVQRRLRSRLALVRDEAEDGGQPATLIREKYLRRLSPMERVLEELPGMRRLARMIEQAGRSTPAYRIVAQCLLAGFAAWMLVAVLAGRPLPGLVLALLVLPLPLARIRARRDKRIRRIEEQLPEALDVMGRALRAGMPLVESFKFVADEMPAPIADEFRTTWSHINYGIGMRPAFDDLLERVPCVSLRAVTTAVLVQRQTGGNLTEILDKVAAVLRARFRFQRRLLTLSAEGRISALVLIVMPFALSGLLTIVAPDYLQLMFDDPIGRKMSVGAVALIALGIVWIRRVIRVGI